MEKGSEKTYKWVIQLLSGCAFDASAAMMGLKKIDQNEFEIDFIGRTYSITKDSIDVKSQNIPSRKWHDDLEYNVKSVLGYYVLSGCDKEPAGDFCPLSAFSHGIFDNRSGWTVSSPLQKAYGKDYTLFKRAAEKTGMVFESERSAGQYIWNYQLLPKLPVKVIYYEGDEDFPTDIQILYDKTAIDFFKFEPLAVLHSSFMHILALVEL
jgi:hypothetical protein